MIPQLDKHGRLPIGRHPATLDQLRDVFVVAAPHTDWRDVIYRAFVLHAELVWRLLPSARLWVDGGFVTHKPEQPGDVDVVIVADPSDPVNSVEDLMPLLTMREVSFEYPRPPGMIKRLQSMGGLVDAHLAIGTDREVLEFWHGWWSHVKGQPDEVAKGYLEISP